MRRVINVAVMIGLVSIVLVCILTHEATAARVYADPAPGNSAGPQGKKSDSGARQASSGTASTTNTGAVGLRTPEVADTEPGTGQMLMQTYDDSVNWLFSPQWFFIRYLPDSVKKAPRGAVALVYTLFDPNYLRALWADIAPQLLVSYTLRALATLALIAVGRSIYKSLMGSVMGTAPRM